ncbi:hypothetical protein Tco_1343197 [Tanacetum coccineum]
MIAYLMKKFLNIPQRIDEDYHSIKDDIPLGSVYTNGNVLVRGMLIPDEFLTEEIHATDKKKDADMGSLETRTEEMPTPIPTPLRSPRTILSSDKNITQELTDIVTLPTATTSKTPHSKRRISNDLIENNLKPSIAATIIKDHDAFRSEVPDLEWDVWVEETIIDKDEVILEDETPELIIKLQNVDIHVPTIFDCARIEATLNDMLSNQFKNAEEYAYHLEQATNFMENQIVWESRQEDIRRPIPRPLILFGTQRNPNEPPSKNEKWVMYLVEIVKFCDATLEKVLKEVKLNIFQSEP